MGGNIVGLWLRAERVWLGRMWWVVSRVIFFPFILHVRATLSFCSLLRFLLSLKQVSFIFDFGNRGIIDNYFEYTRPFSFRKQNLPFPHRKNIYPRITGLRDQAEIGTQR